MKNLFNTTDAAQIILRIQSISPSHMPKWGKMTAGQMLWHCNISLETALSENFPKRLFLGRLFSQFLKKDFIGETEFGKNYPTDKSYKVTEEKEVEIEKARLIKSIEEFYDGGEVRCTSHPHPFFGRLTPMEWAVTQWKHLDHHLRQFGI